MPFHGNFKGQEGKREWGTDREEGDDEAWPEGANSGGHGSRVQTIGFKRRERERERDWGDRAPDLAGVARGRRGGIGDGEHGGEKSGGRASNPVAGDGEAMSTEGKEADGAIEGKGGDPTEVWKMTRMVRRTRVPRMTSQRLAGRRCGCGERRQRAGVPMTARKGGERGDDGLMPWIMKRPSLTRTILKPSARKKEKDLMAGEEI